MSKYRKLSFEELTNKSIKELHELRYDCEVGTYEYFVIGEIIDNKVNRFLKSIKINKT